MEKISPGPLRDGTGLPVPFVCFSGPVALVDDGEHNGCQEHANVMLMATLQVKDVPDDLHRELRRRAALEGLSIRDYLLRLIRNDQQRPPPTEWLARLRRLEPVDLGAPAAELVQADRAARDLKLLPEQRQS